MAALGMVTVIFVGSGVFKNTAREQGSLMMTVKEDMAVFASTTAVSVM